MTGLAAVPAWPARVHDRRLEDHQEKFPFQILSPYLRKAKNMDEVVPSLDIKGNPRGRYVGGFVVAAGRKVRGEIFPSLVVTRQDRETLLTFYEYPAEHWRRRRTTYWHDHPHRTQVPDHSLATLPNQAQRNEGNRQCITLEVGRSMTSEDVIYRLATPFVTHGVPACIRSDNRLEFVSPVNPAMAGLAGHQDALRETGQPPGQNGYVESFQGRLCDELLNLG